MTAVSPLFKPKMSRNKFLGRTHTAPLVQGVAEDETNAVLEYKHIMEEINRDHPDLSVGAQQQMALRRCSAMAAKREGRPQKRVTEPAHMLRALISKMRIGGGEQNDDNGYLPAVESDLHMDGNKTRRARLSLAIRQRSVMLKKLPSSTDLSANCHDNKDNASLQDSLDGIEKPSRFAMQKRGSTRCSARRVSDLTEVDEGEEIGCQDDSKHLEKKSPAVGGERTAQAAKIHELEQSISELPPDELKLVFDAATSPVRKGRKGNRCQLQKSISELLPEDVRLVIGALPPNHMNSNSYNPTSNKDYPQTSAQTKKPAMSVQSSISSFDSTNFQGDFEAWRSFVSNPNDSITIGTPKAGLESKNQSDMRSFSSSARSNMSMKSSSLTVPDDDDFKSEKGDFSAWAKPVRRRWRTE